jgi:glycosyltransferase involved in cell wall biosynthesis
MKILFLTYDFPYPLNSGGKIRAYQLIKGLAQKNEITLFSYYREEEQKKDLRQLKKYCREIYLFKRRKPWRWQNIGRSLLTPLPFASATYYSPDLEKTLVKELRKQRYDLVHFESFYPALYLMTAKKFGVKTLMGNENIEYQVYNRYTDSLKFFPFRWLLKLEVLKMRLFEEKLWRQADVNLALSEEDAQVIKRVTDNPCFIVPNGVDFGLFRKTRTHQEGKTLIFIGTMVYQANNDAVKFFLEKIYPEIKKKVKKVKFTLVSWHKPKWIQRYLQDSSVRLIQDKEISANELLSQADILVAPLRIASGTNIKVLEAMATGLAVVTTSMGIEGIEAKRDKETIIADEPREFAHQVVKLLNDRDRRQALGKAGRLLVEKLYDWSKISQELERAYKKLVYG